MRLGFTAFYQFYQESPEAFRLMGYVGQAKKKDSHWLREWMRLDGYMFGEIASVFELGKRDGSMRGDLDAQKSAYVVAFILTGFFTELAETGTAFIEHFGLDQEEFSMLALDLLASALRAPR
jgi:hypothetical protein